MSDHKKYWCRNMIWRVFHGLKNDGKGTDMMLPRIDRRDIYQEKDQDVIDGPVCYKYAQLILVVFSRTFWWSFFFLIKNYNIS